YYIYSTLASDQVYVERGQNRQIVASVFIAGQANIPNKHMLTSRGVSTKVSAEEKAVLENNKVFQLHRENGFITIESKKANVDKVADSMNNNDPAQPDTEARLDAMKKEKPKTNKGK